MKTTRRLLLTLAAPVLMTSPLHLAAQLTPTTVTVLHSFMGSQTDGSNPLASLVQASDGDFYGTTKGGGTNGAGTVFRITPKGDFFTVHSFAPVDGNGDNADGAVPEGNLVEGSDGAFYGTTSTGGVHSHGTIFRMDSTGTSFLILHNFTRVGADGSEPVAGLIQASDGNFYGTTENGGTGHDGTVFRITPQGKYLTLHSFTGNGSDGRLPQAGVIQGTDGNFYGTTGSGGTSSYYGTVFQMTPAGVVTILHDFEGQEADGGYPFAGLIQGSDGNFYGTAQDGGSDNNGIVFQIAPEGGYTIVHSFMKGGSDGVYPDAGLVQGTDGNFYGTTPEYGGNFYGGIAYQITPAGNYTILHIFTGGSTDAGRPGTLIQGGDGNFYGTSLTGGSNNAGTVFKLSYAPVITSAGSATAYVGAAFSYQITATNDPAKYGVGGLFKGLTVSTQTGVVSGRLTAAGTHTLTLQAANAYDTGTKPLTLTVFGQPVINSSTTATAQVGQPFSYQITANNGPTRYGAQGLRQGLTANASTGVISGTPTAAGEIDLTLQAANPAGTGTAPLTITVAAQ